MKRRSDCPINFALQIFGDAWSLLIIRDIMFFGKTTYGEFLKSEEGIATNILAARLRHLEEVGIVQKKAHAKDKRKDIYRLTPRGIDLLPLLLEMILWSAKQDPQTAAPPAFVTEIKNHKELFIQKMREKLRKSFRAS
jgi:DNA-binding HxlR family transcriptional regulator